MSAIAGVVSLASRSAPSEILDRMMQALSHRGKDNSGAWHDRSVALGYLGLRTLFERSGDRLPLTDRTGQSAITADCRLDNREELLGELDSEADWSGDPTDPALILAAYKKWGTDCAAHLLGDFAVAVWDGRNQTLFCARDHFGVRPLYYLDGGSILAFATEIRPLKALVEKAALNELMVADYLSGVFEDKENTFYKNIFRLPPGHSLIAGNGATRVVCYWKPDCVRELRLRSNEEYSDAFRAVFMSSVQARLRTDYPTGFMLSGGLDSSSITCMAGSIRGKNSTEPLNTFSAVFEEVPSCDERPFIDSVLDGVGPVDSQFFRGDRVSPLDFAERVLSGLDEPIFAPNLFLNCGLYAIARSKGIRVLLDGFDGDTAVSHGTGYFRELALGHRWLKLVREVNGFSRNFGQPPLRNVWWHLWNYALAPKIPVRATRLLRRTYGKTFSRGRAGESSRSRSILNAHFVKRAGVAELRRARKRLSALAPATEREAHLKSVMWAVMPYTLELLDRAAAEHSLELRFPFWDKRVIEFCLSLPPEQKINRGWTRLILRRAMEGILPPDVQWRRGKSNLGANFNYTLAKFDRSRLEGFAVRESALIAEYVDTALLGEMLKKFLEGQVNDNELIVIWRAVSFALWLKKQLFV